ncbi:MAG: hypothetical protein A2540_00495, partial [Sulfurimonas sp. RIFOXYD2_FULL_37_8]
MKFESISSQYEEFLKNIKSYFESEKKSIHKARNEIKIISFKDEDLVVKSFKIPNPVNKIVYTFFKDSKAKKSYENSIKIMGFAPKPIGYIEFKKFGLIDESYFISEAFTYDFSIREPLLDNDFVDKKAIFNAFAEFTFDLHEKGIFHLDYSPGNILVKKESKRYIFKIVDINRMEFRSLSLDERLINFSKLWAKDEDLKLIVKEYCKLAKYDEESCVNLALKY